MSANFQANDRNINRLMSNELVRNAYLKCRCLPKGMLVFLNSAVVISISTVDNRPDTCIIY